MPSSSSSASSRESSDSDQRFFLRPVPRYVGMNNDEEMSDASADSVTDVPTSRLREIMAEYMERNEKETITSEAAASGGMTTAKMPYSQEASVTLNLTEGTNSTAYQHEPENRCQIQSLVDDPNKTAISEPHDAVESEVDVTDIKPFISRNYVDPAIIRLITWERPLVSAGALAAVWWLLLACQCISPLAILTAAVGVKCLALIWARLSGGTCTAESALLKKFECQVLVMVNDFEWLSNKIAEYLNDENYFYIFKLTIASVASYTIGTLIATTAQLFICSLLVFIVPNIKKEHMDSLQAYTGLHAVFPGTSR